MRNPWLELPHERPYVLPADAAMLETRSYKVKARPRFDVPPAPFAGDPSAARLLLLMKAPGFVDADVRHYRVNSAYRRLALAALTHVAEPPLWMLHERLERTPAAAYTWSQLQGLIEVCGTDAVAERVLQVQYFPYKCADYQHFSSQLPSQQYSFELVREQLSRGTPTVAVSGWTYWRKAVPELESYGCIRLKSPISGRLSAGNIEGEDNFERLAALLRAYP